MCLLVVASRVIPGTPLLIGANRDELLSRPATSLTVLRADTPRVLGGRDEQSGGTWLAVNQYGVFAGLTNQPLGDSRDPSRRTRGELPLALASQSDAATAVDFFLDRFVASDYNGSWLFVGDRTALYFIDFTGLVEVAAISLPPGIHVLENRPLGVPSAKVDRVTGALGSLDGTAEVGEIALRRALGDHACAEAKESGDGPNPMPNCVHLDTYGTRSSCLIRYDQDPELAPGVWVADGPPCVTPFIDASRFWVSDAL